MIEFYNRQINHGIRAHPTECIIAMRGEVLISVKRKPDKKLVEYLSSEKEKGDGKNGS